MNKGRATANQLALQSAVFYLKAQIVYKLQDLAYQTEELVSFREKLVAEMLAKVQELDRENFCGAAASAVCGEICGSGKLCVS